MFKNFFRRPTISLSAEGRLCSKALEVLGRPPDTLCEAVQASGVGLVNTAVSKMPVEGKKFYGSVGIFTLGAIIILGWLTVVLVREGGWVTLLAYPIGVMGFFLFCVGAVLLWISFRWAGRHLCPLSIQIVDTEDTEPGTEI